MNGRNVSEVVGVATWDAEQTHACRQAGEQDGAPAGRRLGKRRADCDRGSQSSRSCEKIAARDAGFELLRGLCHGAAPRSGCEPRCGTTSYHIGYDVVPLKDVLFSD